MANEQHVEWLKEGVKAWNKRRVEEPFIPDLGRVNLQGANLRSADLSMANLAGANLERAILVAANLEGADLGAADLEGADLWAADLGRANLQGVDLRGSNLANANLRGVNLGRANLGGADLRGANLRGANIEGANIWGADVRTPKSAGDNLHVVVEFTNLSTTKKISQPKLKTMVGDTGTILPDGLVHPEDWPKWEEGAFKEPDNDNEVAKTSEQHFAPPNYPDQQAAGGTIKFDKDHLVLASQKSVPDRTDLSSIYQELKEDIQDIADSGNLGNISPQLNRTISRINKAMPDDYGDLDQIPFAVLLNGLNLRLKSEAPRLTKESPETLGHLEAASFTGNLILSRLPEWLLFLEENKPLEDHFEKAQEEVEELFGEAADQLENDPDNFDPSILFQLRDYMDGATIYGYLAAKNLLLNIVQSVVEVVHDFAKGTVTFANDIAKETRKKVISAISSAVVVGLGGALVKLTAILGVDYSWVTASLEYIAKVLF